MISNQDLRATLRQRLEAIGLAVERVPGHHPANQLYRFTAGKHVGKTLRLRTNRNYCVMAQAEDANYKSPIVSLEDSDFVGIACISKDNEVECYLVPTSRLVADMKAGHRAAIQRNGPTTSNVRVLYFAENSDPRRAWHGYAQKYSEFLLAERESKPLSNVPQNTRNGTDVIERARRMIAEEHNVSPSAVKIIIEFSASAEG